MSGIVGQTRDRLVSYDAALAHRFMQTTEAFSRVSVPHEAVHEWAQLCSDIASAGWHTWESALAFIDTSQAFLNHIATSSESDGVTRLDPETLFGFGRYGLDLATIAHEPSTAYFGICKELLLQGKRNTRQQWQNTGLLIRSNVTRGTALLTAYFTASGNVMHQHTTAEFSCWLDLVANLLQPKRKQIAAESEPQIAELMHTFFSCCTRSKHKLPWALAMQMPAEHVVDFLELYPQINDWGEDNLSRVCEIVNALRYENDEAAELLSALTGKLGPLSALKRDYVLHTCIKLIDVEARPVVAFINSIDRLPLASPEMLDEWVSQGIAQSAAGRPAATAYFSLESAASIEQLHEIKGQVNFDDLQRLFHLYSEGITGKKFNIESIVSETDGYREFSIARTDGKHIYLPDQISVYPGRADNESLYKITLLHQLGFFESGTFAYQRPGSRNPFAEFFAEFENPALAATLFQILEDGRVDWFLLRKYKGIRRELEWLMTAALNQRPVVDFLISPIGYLLEMIVQYTLGKSEFDFQDDTDAGPKVIEIIAALNQPDATVQDTIQAVTRIYGLIARFGEAVPVDSPTLADEAHDTAETSSRLPVPGQAPEPVDYRGSTRPETVSLGMMLQELEDVLADLMDDQGADGASEIVDPASVKIEQFKRGDVKDAVGMFLTDLDAQLADEGMQAEDLEDAVEEVRKMLQAQGTSKREAGIFKYDEWDYQIADYRKNWCKLHEIVPDGDDEQFVNKTIKDHKPLLVQIKKQLQMLKPELQRKVKGLLDGEEIDLEGAVEAIVDRRSGISPTEKIYIQRQRKERDVSALFLLDMSASTDDVVPDQATELLVAKTCLEQSQENATADEDDFLSLFYPENMNAEPESKRRIIDLEKESVILMAEALEELGDSYAVCGFSGYGKDQVDYYVCKDFDEHYRAEAKGRIGAIKPCRSTRMGPAIRHATVNLARTESRIKALIIISDGYPQDFDYGQDRNCKDYGIQDTTRALAEARQKGVQTFCLTVDQSGHDYLREMCPDQQYMIIQDIAQLPKELSKVYQGLTT